MAIALRHRVSIVDVGAHLLDLTLDVVSDAPLPEGLTIFMPVWTPGSYLVREHARHVEGLTALDGASATKIRKNAWRLTHGGANEVRLRYRLYCNELSVRTNHVDATHAFLNGAATFFALEGHEDAESTLQIAAPEGWRVTTPLQEKAHGYVADGLVTMTDTALEIGRHRLAETAVLGKPLRVAIWPEHALGDSDVARLVEDTRAILATTASLFGGSLPFDDYLLILHVVPRPRAGLEHASSAVLGVSPAGFRSRDGYLDVLSLVAHETFHAWNVKRIRPAGLVPGDYQRESYTRLLWWFEGATSYYDWLVMRRGGLCSRAEYLDHLGREISTLESTPGRFVQSLEEASFDAWIKAYRPDENSQNSSVSYYRKGEIACLVIDLEIRARSGGKKSLDDVLARMWREHGRTGKPVPEDGMLRLVESATELALGDVLAPLVQSAGEIDVAAPLARLGLTLTREARGSGGSSIGARLTTEGDRVHVRSVLRGGAAQRAGVDAGDELLSIAGRRVESTSLDAILHGHVAGDVVEALVARDGRTRTLAITLDPPRVDRVKIQVDPRATAQQEALLRAWIGDPLPSPPTRT